MSLIKRLRPGVECAPWVIEEVEKLTAERDGLKNELALWANPNRSVIREMAALIQERDALKADAERYQWWVNTMTSEFALDTIADAFQHLQQDVVPTKAQFADVIDAAIKGKS